MYPIEIEITRLQNVIQTTNTTNFALQFDKLTEPGKGIEFLLTNPIPPPRHQIVLIDAA